ETLHAMDGVRRVAMVETLSIDDGATLLEPTPRVRFQLANHLGSALLEVDEQGSVISYEEYHPYGTTAYHSATGDVEIGSKRFRYIGRERDEETGLSSHDARYYATWLARWMSTDPAGMADGTCLYCYARGNPITYCDPNGKLAVDPVAEL